jgi:hypothetical protein
MKYFETLPVIARDNPNNDYKIAAINLLARVSIVPELLNNPSLYYTYDIQEGDTPEIIASKYYNDPYRYWIVLFANQLLDPQWDWPKTYDQFNNYLIDKYSAAAANVSMEPIAYTQVTNYEYRKIITTIDSTTSNTTIDKYVVDYATYANTVPTTETVVFTPNKYNNYATVTYEIAKEDVTIYEWEQEQNEKRRTIRILNSLYVGQFEQQFSYLMNI